jgi:hypothetical protein
MLPHHPDKYKNYSLFALNYGRKAKQPVYGSLQILNIVRVHLFIALNHVQGNFHYMEVSAHARVSAQCRKQGKIAVIGLQRVCLAWLKQVSQLKADRR